MKKLVILVFALSLLLSLFGCSKAVVLGEPEQYQINSTIHSLDIRINAADFSIKHGKEFSVESNLKNLTVSEKDGMLSIVEKSKGTVTYTDAMLTLYIPANTTFEKISITTGAARLTADALFANSLKLQLGAGDVMIDELNVSMEADIEGGAGQITIAGGMLNNLDLEMGMGELNLTAALHGDTDLTLGMGEANITLIGSKEDYTVNIEKGIGSITVDGDDVSGFSHSGSSLNIVYIEGGVGAINLTFINSNAPIPL